MWDFADENHVVEVKFEKNVRMFLGGEYKHNPEISYWGETAFGSGKSELNIDVAVNLIQHHGRTHRDKKPAKVISTPTGSFVLRISELICSKKIYERVFHQNIISMREEYFEALAQGKKRKALWIMVRGHLWLIWTVIFQLFVFAVSGPIKIIKSIED